MRNITFNNVGFNAQFIKEVSVDEFIARHKHLWPEQQDRAKVEQDLRTVYDIIRNPKKQISSRSESHS